jgi:hypothetical protein
MQRVFEKISGGRLRTESFANKEISTRQIYMPGLKFSFFRFFTYIRAKKNAPRTAYPLFLVDILGVLLQPFAFGRHLYGRPVIPFIVHHFAA